MAQEEPAGEDVGFDFRVRRGIAALWDLFCEPLRPEKKTQSGDASPHSKKAKTKRYTLNSLAKTARHAHVREAALLIADLALDAQRSAITDFLEPLAETP